MRPLPPVLLLMLVLPGVAAGYEGEVRRQEVDGGVHVPVLTKAPTLVRFVQAVYPAEAQAAGVEGSVKLQVTIAADGTVAEATVAEPAGQGFDAAAVEAVKQFEFTPAEVDGVPAPIQIVYEYHFTLAPPAPADGGVPVEAPKLGIIEGDLIARGSRNRVPGATVRCGDEEEAPEAISDANGHFKLEAPPGTCQVRVLAAGFRPFQTKEEVSLEEIADVLYYLLPKVQGYETVIRGERDKKEVVRRTLERQELQRVPGTFGDPIRVLQNLPGVARAPFISGALIVRGAAPDETLTYLDGVEIPILYHLGGGPSVVNAEFLDRVDFFPGGFGARYGRAVGGVVDVATRKGAVDTIHGSAKVDFLDSGFFIEAPIVPGLSIAAAARRSYIDVLLPLVLPNDPETGTLLALPQYWDYQIRLDYGSPRNAAPGAPINTYYLMAFGSDDLLKVVATGGGRNRDVSVDVHTLFHRVKGDWTFRQGGFTSVFSPFAGYDLANFAFGATTFKSDLYSLGAREDLAFELSKNITLRGGADVLFDHLLGTAELPVISGLQYIGFPGAQPKTEMQTLTRSINSFDGAVYLEADFKLGGLTVTPGVRASYARLYGQERTAVDPRLWMRYQLLPQTTLKGSLGLYSQPPAASNLEPGPIGSTLLAHERAFQSSFGIEHRITDAINVDVVGFYNRRYDLVVAGGPTLVLDDASRVKQGYANQGLGRAYGIEILARHEVTKNFFGWIAYTLSKSEARRAGSEDPYQLTTFDETHILTVVGSYRLPLGFEVGARFRLVTGRPSTPLAHDADLYNADSNSYGRTFGDPLSSRLRTFQQLDLRVDKTFAFRDWSLGVYLDVQNVYNVENIEAVFYDYRSRSEYYLPGIPVLPVLGVKGSF